MLEFGRKKSNSSNFCNSKISIVYKFGAKCVENVFNWQLFFDNYSNSMIMSMWLKHCYAPVLLFNNFTKNTNHIYIGRTCANTRCNALNQYHLVFDSTNFCIICIVYHSVMYFAIENQTKNKQTNNNMANILWMKNNTKQTKGYIAHIISSVALSPLPVRFWYECVFTFDFRGTDLWVKTDFEALQNKM